MSSNSRSLPSRLHLGETRYVHRCNSATPFGATNGTGGGAGYCAEAGDESSYEDALETLEDLLPTAAIQRSACSAPFSRDRPTRPTVKHREGLHRAHEGDDEAGSPDVLRIRRGPSPSSSSSRSEESGSRRGHTSMSATTLDSIDIEALIAAYRPQMRSLMQQTSNSALRPHQSTLQEPQNAGPASSSMTAPTNERRSGPGAKASARMHHSNASAMMSKSLSSPAASSAGSSIHRGPAAPSRKDSTSTLRSTDIESFEERLAKFWALGGNPSSSSLASPTSPAPSVSSMPAGKLLVGSVPYKPSNSPVRPSVDASQDYFSARPSPQPRHPRDTAVSPQASQGRHTTSPVPVLSHRTSTSSSSSSSHRSSASSTSRTSFRWSTDSHKSQSSSAASTPVDDAPSVVFKDRVAGARPRTPCPAIQEDDCAQETSPSLTYRPFESPSGYCKNEDDEAEESTREAGWRLSSGSIASDYSYSEEECVDAIAKEFPSPPVSRKNSQASTVSILDPHFPLTPPILSPSTSDGRASASKDSYFPLFVHAEAPDAPLSRPSTSPSREGEAGVFTRPTTAPAMVRAKTSDATLVSGKLPLCLPVHTTAPMRRKPTLPEVQAKQEAPPAAVLGFSTNVTAPYSPQDRTLPVTLTRKPSLARSKMHEVLMPNFV